MYITFNSKIDQNGEKQEVEFTSKVEIGTYKEFKVFEFKEPESQINNRIEVSDKAVNIFAGVNTISLSKLDDIKIEYITQNGVLNFLSKLHKLNVKEELINFEYSLLQNETKVGTYNITLTIAKTLTN